MTRRRRKIAQKISNRGLCVFSAMMTLAVSDSAFADWYIVPSVSVAAVHDDNLFLTSGDEVEDSLVRVTPALSLGYESEKSILDVEYRQDLEVYADNSDLDDNSVRRFLEASLVHRPVSAVELSLEVMRNESVFPSELSLGSDPESSRVPSKRTTVNPGILYHFSGATTALLEYVHLEELSDGGADGEARTIHTVLTHALSGRSQLTAGYAYSEYKFSGGLDQSVHAPRVGFIHAFSERTTVNVSAGPRYVEDEDSVDVDVSASLNYDYGRGEVLIGYDREAVTLIGEAGIVESNGVRATLRHSFTDALEVNVTAGYGEFERLNDFDDEPTKASRIGIEANYAVNDAITVFAQYAHSYQDGSSQPENPFEVSRNVFSVGITLRLPRS